LGCFIVLIAARRQKGRKDPAALLLLEALDQDWPGVVVSVGFRGRRQGLCFFRGSGFVSCSMAVFFEVFSLPGYYFPAYFRDPF
jgi:hypothetical protein